MPSRGSAIPANVIITAFGLLLLGGAVFAWIAWEPEFEPVTVDRAAMPPDLVARGEQLAAVGNCGVCHTPEGAEPYAGGYAMDTPFGVIHSTNITPDPETGIGTWSEAAFIRSMREGVDREGRHLYPAFPYHFFVRTSDEDLRAIYAYIMAQEPVRAEARENELIFPLGFRPLIAGWKLFFHREGRFEPMAVESDTWNRGAYFVEGLGHCGACHMPINALGGPRRDEGLSGGETEGWIAPALNEANPSPYPWSEEALAHYLAYGRHIHHAAAAGPMRPVIASLDAAAEEDVQAMAHYLATLSPEPEPTRLALPRAYPPRRSLLAAAVTTTEPMGAEHDVARGDLLYAGLCASCHYVADPAVLDWPRLSTATALHLEAPDNLIRVILDGVGDAADPPDRFMPAFGMGDAELEALLDHLRQEIADRPPWPDLGDAIASVREERAEAAP
jgi:mono/diheme cytochrome c family protein